MRGLVNIASFGSRTEGEMMVELLRNEGIDAMLEVDDAGGLRPEVPMGMGGAKVLVRPEDEERAREILEHGGDGED
jgi:hypothetical protein